MAWYDFFGGGTDASNPQAQQVPQVAPTTPDNAGIMDWITKNPTQFAALMGGAAKAVDPTGQTGGGALGSAIQGVASSKIAADAAKQSADERKAAEADRKALMARLGLTPPGQPGPTKIEMTKNGELVTTETPTGGVQKPTADLSKAFGGDYASNFL